MSTHAVYLILITLIAGTVNGALGYGFSSITVPLDGRRLDAEAIAATQELADPLRAALNALIGAVDISGSMLGR